MKNSELESKTGEMLFLGDNFEETDELHKKLEEVGYNVKRMWTSALVPTAFAYCYHSFGYFEIYINFVKGLDSREGKQEFFKRMREAYRKDSKENLKRKERIKKDW